MLVRSHRTQGTGRSSGRRATSLRVGHPCESSPERTVPCTPLVMDDAIDQAPPELQACIKSLWPEEEWNNAAAISKLESGWNAFAVRDTTDTDHPCGSFVGAYRGVPVSAELSVGYFQINYCVHDVDSDWRKLWNADFNTRVAFHLWQQRGNWSDWYFSALQLGLI